MTNNREHTCYFQRVGTKREKSLNHRDHPSSFDLLPKLSNPPISPPLDIWQLLYICVCACARARVFM
ncbi:hypothetical protein Hanom_Chr11g01053961 [Helianthus anomalus]